MQGKRSIPPASNAPASEPSTVAAWISLREIILVFVSGSQEVMYVINCIPGSVYFLISDQKIQYGEIRIQ
jgi:hypothetical protein